MYIHMYCTNTQNINYIINYTYMLFFSSDSDAELESIRQSFQSHNNSWIRFGYKSSIHNVHVSSIYH